ncbi:MAG: Glu/Leu/Phe/Val dehydrogenase [Acidimicrobiia bacterium]|nr:Glu/Leu/Phe/Val dehydrogenase [Acidimicrobiia bacterium]
MQRQWRGLIDELGPEKVVLLTEPSSGLEGIVVVDNTAAGPAIGGVRMAVDVSVGEVFRLARAMTLKNAAAGLAHGGGKAAIIADPRISEPAKEQLVRAFAVAIEGLSEFIAGPDMGTDEACMAHVHDEIGRSVGLPRVLGGIPLDELGATAFGLAVAAEVAEEFGHVKLDGARVVIQGFGAVGRPAARLLADRGALIVAVSDSRGAIVNQAGLDVEKLVAWKESGHGVPEFGGGTTAGHEELIAYPCDIWVPAARPDVFTGDNAGEVAAQVILPGANIATTEAAERVFFDRGIVSLPDFIVNAGGVICAATEYAGETPSHAFRVIDEKIRSNTRLVLESAQRTTATPLAAAHALASGRVEEAMRYRRRF